MRRLLLASSVFTTLAACDDIPSPKAAVPAPTIARLTLREPLDHRWEDALVGFDLPSEPGGAVHVVDAAGVALPAEIERRAGRVRLRTVMTLGRGEAATLAVRPGSVAAAGSVEVRREARGLVLRNDRLEVTLPRWEARADLGELAPPIASVGRPGAPPIGEARWVSSKRLGVLSAESEIVAEGPVRAAVRQRVRFADGRGYSAVIELSARQDAAIVTEDSDEVALFAAHRLILPGRVLWTNHGSMSGGVPQWSVVETPPGPVADGDLACKLRPWSFWWLPRLAEAAGFLAPGADTMTFVATLRPSLWSPTSWDGFERSEVPVTVLPDGRAAVSFPLAATEKEPLHRVWALSALPVADPAPEARAAALRRALLRHGEFPLDEVKDYGFDAASSARAHPSLLLDAAAVTRARAQARTDPQRAERLRDHERYFAACGPLDEILAKEGPAAFFELYNRRYLRERLLEAYLSSDDPRYGRWLAAVTLSFARQLLDTFLEKPSRPALGAFGPWFSEEVTQLVVHWDLAADLLTPEARAFVERALVFGAHVLAHPDYWNLDRGLASANPNMTASIFLPRALLGLALDGHPEAAAWRREGDKEMAKEIAQWISPGGAWVECPHYQAAWFDSMFLLAEATRRRTGTDLFADPRVRDTYDYAGFLITPPDVRFAPKGTAVERAPSVDPSLGHTPAGWMTPFHGLAAGATAVAHPEFSARQQFFWNIEGRPHVNAGRAKGLVAALANTDLRAAPPAETARAFPGFGAVLRSSWTDPRASYVAYRTGPNEHHYAAGELGEVVYYAKGAPLCVDWGNFHTPHSREEAWYHNTVAFDTLGKWTHGAQTGQIRDTRELPGFAAVASGIIRGGGQEDLRHVLLVEAPDPLGPNYLVMRDHTADPGTYHDFYWSLFCLSREPEVKDRVVHYPGQFGVDLDLFILSPREAPITRDRWSWSAAVSTWGQLSEEQHGVHVHKVGSREDFFTVLYPSTAKERAPRAVAVAEGRATRVDHGEGTDLVLLSPGSPGSAREAGASLSGEIALARRTKASLRLVVLSGAPASAEMDGWALSSSAPVALEITRAGASGVTSGEAHEVVITPPSGWESAALRLDGAAVAAPREGRAIRVSVPPGAHRLSLTRR
jgi:hypothetical protein